MRCFSRSVVSLVLALVATEAMGTTPVMVRDIGDGLLPSIEEYFLHYGPPVVMGGSAYFFNDDGIHGRELWKSDGTSDGTRMIRDLCPGSCETVSLAEPHQVAALVNRVVFLGNDGVHGLEPWVTDGTQDGTLLLGDLRPGLRGSRPSAFFSAEGRVFFNADDGVHGTTIWVTDGTPAGTRLVDPLASPDRPLGMFIAAPLGPVLIFGSRNEDAPGLWRTDGTAAGTYRLSEVMPPQQNWTANAQMQEINGRLVFGGIYPDGNYYQHAWVTDGTVAGTAELAQAEFPSPFSKGEGEIYFFTWDGFQRLLWRTDGTSGGTTSFPLPAGVEPVLAYGFLASLDHALFFVGWDEAHGSEPWIFDSGGFRLVKDVAPGADSSMQPTLESYFDGSFSFMAQVGAGVVFMADDGVHGVEPWVTDGTEAGTNLVIDLTPGSASTRLDLRQGFLSIPLVWNSLLFRVRPDESGRFLARSDGSTAGTSTFAELNRQTSGFWLRNDGASAYENPSAANCFEPLGGGVLFAPVDLSHGWEPWFSPRADAGAELVEDVAPGADSSFPLVCKAVGGHGVVFLGGYVPDPGLFSASPDSSGLTRLASGTWGQDPVSWAHWRGALSSTTDAGLGHTDGTPGGTAIEPTVLEDFYPYELVAEGELLYAGGFDLRIWSETDHAFLPLTGLDPDLGINPERLTPFGSKLLFFAYSPDTSGNELWGSDGTPEGTSLIKDVRSGVASGIPESFYGSGRSSLTRIVPLGGRAVFAADDGVHGEELWVTDGTTEGTEMLADLYPGPYPSVPREMVRVGGWVYFVAEGPGVGRELWRTNGLPGGTSLVLDVVPGTGSSIPQHLTAGGSELYFSAWTATTGREPWRLRDHGAARPGMRLLADIAEGPKSSSPEAFLEVRGGLFLVANDNLSGFELWHLQEDDSIFSDGFEGSDARAWDSAVP